MVPTRNPSSYMVSMNKRTLAWERGTRGPGRTSREGVVNERSCGASVNELCGATCQRVSGDLRQSSTPTGSPHIAPPHSPHTSPRYPRGSATCPGS